MFTSIVEDYESKQGQVWGHRVRVVTYRISDKFVCLIENLDVGAAICRVSAHSKMDALQIGLSRAQELVGKSAPPRSVVDAQAAPESCTVHIDQIVMNVDGKETSYTIDAFNALSVRERMSQIMSGNITFYTLEGEVVPAANALEILRGSE